MKALCVALLLLAVQPIYGNTLLVQSNAVTSEYGDSIARHYPNSRLIMLRDFSQDRHENIEHVLGILQLHSLKYDNLVLLGYRGTVFDFKHPSVTHVPLYSDLSVYESHLSAVLYAFPSKNKVQIFCNNYCPSLPGTVHNVQTTVQLRGALTKLDREDVVVNSLDTLLDPDSQRYVYGAEITETFQRHQVLDIGLLRSNHTISIIVTPQAISDNKANVVEIVIQLSRLNALGREKDFLRASGVLKNLRAEP